MTVEVSQRREVERKEEKAEEMETRLKDGGVGKCEEERDREVYLRLLLLLIKEIVVKISCCPLNSMLLSVELRKGK